MEFEMEGRALENDCGGEEGECGGKKVNLVGKNGDLTWKTHSRLQNQNSAGL